MGAAARSPSGVQAANASPPSTEEFEPLFMLELAAETSFEILRFARGQGRASKTTGYPCLLRS